eukprot:TRINITY_DN297_c0_g1_i4.p1 TRINITY_DN297_c0_g1~~TRINITY_DN297_c0_g1_i4.p1  ORF type:complete len:384 (+),score=89.31 TRINITY_DN297_c0_g1_i4:45-1196(+)
MNIKKCQGWPSSNPITLDLCQPATREAPLDLHEDALKSPVERTKQKLPSSISRKEGPSRLQQSQITSPPPSEHYFDGYDEEASHQEASRFYKNEKDVTRPSPAPAIPKRSAKDSVSGTSGLKRGDAMANKVKFLESELQKSEGNVQELLKYIEKIKRQREEMRAETAQLRDDIERLQLMQVRATDENTSLKAENNSLKAENQRLRRDLNSMAAPAIKRVPINPGENQPSVRQMLQQKSISEHDDNFRVIRAAPLETTPASVLSGNTHIMNGVIEGRTNINTNASNPTNISQMEPRRIGSPDNYLNTSSMSSNNQLPRTILRPSSNLGSPNKPAILNSSTTGQQLRAVKLHSPGAPQQQRFMCQPPSVNYSSQGHLSMVPPQKH